MIINVETPSFCPDDCDYYEQEKQMTFMVADGKTEIAQTIEKCKNEGLCIHARQLCDRS